MTPGPTPAEPPARRRPWRSAALGWAVAAAVLVAGVPPFLCMPPWNDVTLHDMAEAPRAEGGWILLGERSPGARSSSTRMRLRALIDSVREDAEQERD